jgi:ATP-binding cassette subfamily B protein
VAVNRQGPPPGMRARIADELWRAVWQYRKQTAISVALMVVAKVATVAVPLVLKQIVDAFSRPQAAALFPVFLVLAYAILRFVGNALNEVRDMVFSRVTLSTVASFTERTFHHLHRMGARFHAQRETGAIVRDVEKGTQGIGFLLGVAIFTIVPTLVEIGSVIAILIAGYSIGFTAIIGATFACYAVYTIALTRRRVSVQREMNRLEAQSNSRLVDSLLNTDTVKYFATEDAETRRLATVLDRWTDVGSANQRVLSTLHIGQSAVIGAGIAAMMLLAAQYVAVGRMSVGDLVLVNAYIIQVCDGQHRTDVRDPDQARHTRRGRRRSRRTRARR